MKKKWYDKILILIAKVICRLRGHDWVGYNAGRYCRCCGKAEEYKCCMNCVYFKNNRLWCRKNKTHVNKQPSVCDFHQRKLNIYVNHG